MKIHLALIAILSASTFLAVGAPPEGQTWKLVWGDEFDGKTLDPLKWGSGEKPWHTTNNGPCLITAEDSYLEGGALMNRTRAGHFTGNGKSYQFACGYIYTKTWLQYGYLEIRAQYPVGKDQWPAFWMLRKGWPPEVDIAEFRGANGESDDYMTQALFDETRKWNTTRLPGDYTGWHTYGFEWAPTYIKWYVDGKVTKTVENPRLKPEPMYVILSAGVGESADPQHGFPSYCKIDYFRWYQVEPKPSQPGKK